MSSMTRTNLWLALLVLGLGLIAFFQPGLRQDELLPLTGLATEAITTVEVRHQGEPKLLLSRSDGRWQMRKPRQAVADPAKVQKLLDIAALPSIHQFAAPLQRLEEFGLGETAYLLRLDAEEIRFGKTEAVTGARYTLIGNTVHLVPDNLYHHLLSPATAFLEQ